MKRDGTVGKWLENNFDVNIRAASNTYMQVWNAQLDNLFQKVKEYRSWGRQPREVGTLIDCVDDDVHWLLCGDKEHLTKTILQKVDTWLLRAVPVCPIHMRKYLATVQVGGKLNEN